MKRRSQAQGQPTVVQRIPDSHLSSSSNQLPTLAYCSHACLLALKTGDADQTASRCPNAAAHSAAATSLTEVQHALRQSQQRDSSPNVTLLPLGLSGARGVLLKVHLASSGHCFVAKGFAAAERVLIERELDAYERLADIQGQQIPVCCDSVSLSQPVQASGRSITHLLLLSYGGSPILSRYPKGSTIPQAYGTQFTAALQAMHSRQVVHGDPELKNVLLDAATDRLMVVDLERSRLYGTRPPCDPSGGCTKRAKDSKNKLRLCMYCRELSIAESAIAEPDYD